MRTVAGTLLILMSCLAGASAQDWPNRPLTMVVPFAAGGPVDVLGRILAQGFARQRPPAIHCAWKASAFKALKIIYFCRQALFFRVNEILFLDRQRPVNSPLVAPIMWVAPTVSPRL